MTTSCLLAVLSLVPVRGDAVDAPTLVFEFIPGAENPRSVTGLMFSFDGNVLAAADSGRLVSWDTRTGATLHADDGVSAWRLVGMKSDVALIERSSASSPYAIRKASTGEVFGNITVPAQAAPRGAETKLRHRSPSYTLAGGGSKIYDGPLAIGPVRDLAACVIDHAAKAGESTLLHEDVLLFNAHTGKVVQRLKPPRDPGTSGSVETPGPVLRLVNDLEFSPDGKKIAAIALTGTVVVWDCADGKILHNLIGAPVLSGSWPVSLRDDGDCIAQASRRVSWLGGGDTLVTGPPKPDFDVPGMRRLTKWKLPATCEPLEWLGAKLGESIEEQARVAEESVEAAGTGVPQVRFIVLSGDGNRALAVLEESQTNNRNLHATRPGVEWVDLQNGHPIGLLCVPPKDWITAAAFSADSKQIALATQSGAVVVLPVAEFDEFARQQRSIADVGCAFPIGATASDAKPAIVTASDQPTEFELFDTGVRLATRLDVVERYHMRRERDPAPKSLRIGGVASLTAVVEPHSSYKETRREFESARIPVEPSVVSARAALRPFLDGRERVLGVSFNEDVVEVGDARLYLYSAMSPDMSAPNARVHLSEMHAVIEQDRRNVRIHIAYPQSAAESVGTHVRDMLLGFKLQ